MVKCIVRVPLKNCETNLNEVGACADTEYKDHEQNARGREQNAAGGRKIYERPDQPTNKKHETCNCKADATV